MFVRPRLVLFFGLICLALLPLAAQTRPDVTPPAIREYPILNTHRIELLRAYMKAHYGMDSTVLERPALIVVHYTEIPTLAATLATFKPDKLPAGRTDIAGHGDANVSVHYVIDRDGAVYRLQPENVVARHVIGFNRCALGIEMVARRAADLTAAQAESCARLVAWIAFRNPSVEYLIGHHEYMRRDYPHFALFKENDPTYKPTVKTDPGDAFMQRLRETLASKYSISLKK